MLLLCGWWSFSAQIERPWDRLWAEEVEETPDEETDELAQYRPGLVATYRGADDRLATRIDRELTFDWGAAAPDDRLWEGPFTAQWQGRLFAIEPGEYRLLAFAQGNVSIRVNGQLVLDTVTADPSWIAGQPVTLEFGYHPLTVAYDRRDAAAARLALYWEGPQFQLEPLPGTVLFHDPASGAEESFEQGRQLAQALRCGACHLLPSLGTPRPGPDLTRLQGQLFRQAAIERLTLSASQPHDSEARPWPHGWLPSAQAATVVEAIFAQSKPLPQSVSLPAGKATAGRQLLETVGCLACHRLDGLGDNGPWGGGDLGQVARRRPADFFSHWLAAPQQLNADHRMPVFALKPQEVADLSAFLATCGQPPKASPATGKVDRAAAQAIVAAWNCAACHRLPEALAAPQSTLRPLPEEAARAADRQELKCLQIAGDGVHPRYQLSADAAHALTIFWREQAGDQKAAAPRPPTEQGQQVMRERNCLGCHARGERAGIAATLDELIGRRPELALFAPALSPPALHGVGDKLTRAALSQALAAERSLRPWLQVRMPKFQLPDGERTALHDYLEGHDQIPPDAPPPLIARSAPRSADSAALEQAGRRLVTADGFGCTSCHDMGRHVPKNVALNARGTNLSLLAERIRRPWYERWVRNPARIVPRMEMPSVQQPIRGVLDDQLADQLAAVWHVLNIPGFDPPPPHPVRVVRASGDRARNEPVRTVSDVVEAPGRLWIKPLVIGLPNRHNVLLDLERGELAAWWLGDALRQRTRGKSWYWELGSEPLFRLPEDTTGEWLPTWGQDALEPAPWGQFSTRLLTQRHVGDTIELQRQIRFSAGGRSETVVTLQDRLAPLWPEDATADAQNRATGFVREMTLPAPQPGNEPLSLSWRWPSPLAATWDARGKVLVPRDANQHWTLTIETGKPHWDAAAGVLTVEPNAAPAAPSTIRLAWRTTLPSDQYLAVVAPSLPLPAARLNVVPGFEVTQLPLPAWPMPTGLAWNEAGRLFFCALKGEVVSAHDSDGDGLEDRLQLFADGLAAPYGLQTVPSSIAGSRGTTVDVVHKHELLRLFDNDGDGVAESRQVLADGWGHTADYHDWAVGLPRDPAGNYYVGLPCQQDERSPAAAVGRGTVLRLRPGSSDAARPFSLETIAAGLRFPMGLALDREEALYVTDNQGNYNPFNELNHIVAGRRYGFINRLESKPGFAPPAESAAIEIPHPWTRSVNGVAFLEAPATMPDRFGPFAGHLIGCEYDTRRLVRMSVQTVGEMRQGAVYPFSTLPEHGPNFEGPVVCQVSPSGDLWVGNLRDSGWGAGNNTGSLVRLRPTGAWPLGIAEVVAVPDGFTLRFTRPVDPALAAQPDRYAIESFRRIATPDYGGPDVDRRRETVRNVQVSDNGREVRLKLEELRAGFVYEVRLLPLTSDQRPLFPAEAWYTLRQIPAE